MVSDSENLVEYMASLDRTRVLLMTRKMLNSGTSSDDIFELIHRGSEQVSNSYSAGEYFIADLIMSDLISREVAEIIMNATDASERPIYGTVMLATVQGDIHDMGKGFTGLMLTQNGFRVNDIGSDISSDGIVSSILTNAPDAIILYGSIDGSEIMMARTIEEIENAGLRGCIKIILSGSCVNERQSFAIGADGYAFRPVDSLRLCRQMIIGEV